MDIKDGLLKVIVKPNSKCNKIYVKDGKVRVDVKAVADKDKANKELVKFVSKELGRKVRIKKGLRSREKVLRIG